MLRLNIQIFSPLVAIILVAFTIFNPVSMFLHLYFSGKLLSWSLPSCGSYVVFSLPSTCKWHVIPAQFIDILVLLLLPWGLNSFIFFKCFFWTCMLGQVHEVVQILELVWTMLPWFYSLITDTCQAFSEYVQKPANTTVDELLPCMNLATATSTSNVVNQGVSNIILQVRCNWAFFGLDILSLHVWLWA